MVEAADRPDADWAILFACWLVVTGATLGSLFFSEVMELPPCSLCWYQRIFLFPLPILLFLGLFPFDARAVRYALPLAVLGWGTACYHTLLHLGVIPKAAAPCSRGVSCSDKDLDLFGFVSIPMLSLGAFTVRSMQDGPPASAGPAVLFCGKADAEQVFRQFPGRMKGSGRSWKNDDAYQRC